MRELPANRSKPRLTALGLLGVCASVLLSACGLRQESFSQYPGFDTWYAANPPSTKLPSIADQALLEQHQPRLFIAHGSGRPIRFYEDYIAHGHLTDSQGKVLSTEVDQALLNRVRNDPTISFTHNPYPTKAIASAAISVAKAANSTEQSNLTSNADLVGSTDVIARIDRETLPAAAGEPARQLLFLTYHYVFAHSGVAAGIRPWQRGLVKLIADPADWHQLDHYTAVSIVLDEQSLRPLAALLQQHNYLRTWLFASQPGPGRTTLPADGRIKLTAARDSNELYLWREGQQFRRAVPMLSPDNIDWLVFGRDRPWVSADDITDPAIEIAANLRLLAPSDAFFTFKGWLGERRRIKGRDGPPGADFNTLPTLKSRATQLALFWWYEQDEEYVSLFKTLTDRDTIQSAPYIERLVKALKTP